MYIPPSPPGTAFVVPPAPHQILGGVVGGPEPSRSRPALPLHGTISHVTARHARKARLLTVREGESADTKHQDFVSGLGEPRQSNRGKRFSTVLRFFFMGPVLFFLWPLLKPSIASASIHSTVAAGTVLATDQFAMGNDMNKMLHDAMQAFGMDPANPEWVKLSKEYFVNIIPLIPKIIFQLSICILAFRFSTVAGASLRTYSAERNFDLTTVSFLVGLVRYSMLLVATIIVFRSLGVAPPQSVTALVTSISLAIGLAFQSVLGNVAAGLMLLVFRPYSVGDKVNIGNRVGFVYDISLLTTRLDTEDNTRIQVPNSEVFKGVVENYTLNPLRRVEVPILVAHAGNVAHTREVLDEVVAQFAYLSIAGSTRAPKADKKKSSADESSAATYMSSLSVNSTQPLSSKSKSKSKSKPKAPSSSSTSTGSSSTTLYLESLAHGQPPRSSRSKSAHAREANVTKDTRTRSKEERSDTDDGVGEHQERLLDGFGWLGGLTRKGVKPVIKTMSRSYDQFMRVAEIQYQNADISVMTKVPRPEVVMKEITPLGQQWIARVWAPSRRYNRVRCRMTEEVAKALQDGGVPVVGMGPAVGAGPSEPINGAYLAGVMAGSKTDI